MKSIAGHRGLTRRIGGLAALGVVALAIAGCSASADANLTLAADDVAGLGAQAMGEQWDAEATMDCGEDSVPAVEGTEVDCVAYNPKSGLDYPAVVTLSTVDGSTYTVTVAVGAPVVPDDGANADAPSDAPTVSGANLAGIAAPALAAKLGYEPALDCGTEPIAIYVDAEIQCVATDDNGVRHAADIVVTEVTATDYKIDVDMLKETFEG